MTEYLVWWRSLNIWFYRNTFYIKRKLDFSSNPDAWINLFRIFVMNISWGNICWFQNMNFSSLNSVTNTSYRNTFCNVAVDYELVAFWRYFINRLFLFHHQIVFISSSDLLYFIFRPFLFQHQIFFLERTMDCPRRCYDIFSWNSKIASTKTEPIIVDILFLNIVSMEFKLIQLCISI